RPLTASYGAESTGKSPSPLHFATVLTLTALMCFSCSRFYGGVRENAKPSAKENGGTAEVHRRAGFKRWLVLASMQIVILCLLRCKLLSLFSAEITSL